MHYIRRPSLKRSIFISSLGLIGMMISFWTSIIFAAWHLLPFSNGSPLPLIVSASSCLVFSILYLCRKGRCQCQLCRAPMLSSQRCHRNEAVKSLFGSFRLRLAASVLILRKFRCSYCGESFSCASPEEAPEPESPARRPRRARPIGTLPTPR